MHVEPKRSSELRDSLGCRNRACWEIHLEAVNLEAVNLEAVNPEAVNREAVVLEAVDREVCAMEAETLFIG